MFHVYFHHSKASMLTEVYYWYGFIIIFQAKDYFVGLRIILYVLQNYNIDKIEDAVAVCCLRENVCRALTVRQSQAVCHPLTIDN